MNNKLPKASSLSRKKPPVDLKKDIAFIEINATDLFE